MNKFSSSIFWRSKVAMHPTGEATGEVERIIMVMNGKLKRVEIQRLLGLKHEDHFRNTYLTPAIDSGYVEMTLPGKPKSPKQRYRLTDKGEKL